MPRTLEQREELANTVTHGVGLLAALAGTLFLILAADTITRAVTAGVFGVGLICCYGTSTAFHIATDARRKSVWRQLDHAAIYVLIAATYFAVLPFAPGGAIGWWMAGIVWAVGIAGIVRKVLLLNKGGVIGKFDLTLYIAMGWIWLLAAKPIYDALSSQAFLWLLAGGAAYTGGAVFFRLDKMNYNHAIWHVFVLAGSGCHFVVVAFYR